MTVKLNKANAMLSKLRQSTLQYLCSIYAMLLFFGYKILKQLKRLNALQIMFFQSRNFHLDSLFKGSEFLNPLIRQLLKTNYFLVNILMGYCHLSSTAGSSFILRLTFMMLDEQILVIIKYPLTVLKPVVDIQWL